jgi:hypothetical protein
VAVANEGDTITLDGSKSTDSGGGNQLLYHWEQVPTAGPVVDLSDPTAVTPTFIAPKDLSDITKLTFKLVVTDNLDVNDKAYHGNHDSTPASVDVSVCPSKVVPSLISASKNVPVPDPTTGTCDYSRVEVRQKGVHLFIVFTDNAGKEYYYRGGPLVDPALQYPRQPQNTAHPKSTV